MKNLHFHPCGNYKEKYEQEIIADTKIEAKSFDEIEGKITPDALAKLTIAGDDLMAMFEQTIKNNLGSFKNIKRLYKWSRMVL